MEQDYEKKIAELVKECREEARKRTTFDELEDLAYECHQVIGNILLQGIAGDKGDGRNIELPESLNSFDGKKPKNKGLKKKTCLPG